MKARQIIEGATFDAMRLKVLFEAFDGVWDEISASVGPGPETIEAERSRLASIILTLAEHGPVDLDGLKSTAKGLFCDPGQK